MVVLAIIVLAVIVWWLIGYEVLRRRAGLTAAEFENYNDKFCAERDPSGMIIWLGVMLWPWVLYWSMRR